MTADHNVHAMVIDARQTSTPTAPEVSVRPSEVGEAALKAIIGIGILLRLYHFAARRSLWIDEARLALDILSRGYIDLLRQLDWDQSAAPAFLWLTRFVTQLVGSGELALRTVAFVAGVGALLLLYRITPPTAPGILGPGVRPVVGRAGAAADLLLERGEAVLARPAGESPAHGRCAAADARSLTAS